MADDYSLGRTYTGFGPSYPVGPNTSSTPSGGVSGPLGSKDSMESGSNQAGLSQSFGLALKDGRISIAEFAKLVQTVLDKAKETGFDEAAKDAKLNKNFGQAILDEFALMQQIKDAIFELGKQAEQLYNSEQSSVNDMNSKIGLAYQGQAADKSAIDTYNKAVENYNNPSSPDYHNSSKLDGAKTTYNNYVEARNAEINKFNGDVDSYNANAHSDNSKFDKISGDLSQYSWIANGQKLKGQESQVTHYTGAPLVLAVGNSPVSQINAANASLIQTPHQFDMNAYMDKYWGPVQSRFLEQMIDLAKTIDFHINIDAFNGMRGRMQGLKPQNMLMMNLMTTIMSNSNSGGHSLGMPFHTSFINRMTAKALQAAVAEQNGVLIPQTAVMEMQHAVMSGLSKASLYSSSTPAMKFLGDQFAKLNLPDAAYSMAMSFAFGGRIASMVQGDALNRSCLNAIEKDPALAKLTKEEKTQLADQLTASMNLCLLNAAVMNMAITLGTPGLVSEVMSNALKNAGIEGVGTNTLGACLADRSTTLNAQGEAAKFLVDLGFSSEYAAHVLGESVSNTLNFGPYATTQDFMNQLSMQLQLQGLGEGLSRSIAIDFTASILGNNPTATLSGNDLDTSVSLGLISKDVFLSNAAKTAALAGVDPALGSFYENAVNALLSQTNPSAILEAFAQGLGSNGIMNAMPPVTLQDIRDAMSANLIAQGVDGASSWKIANNFTDMIKSGEPFDMALQVNPFSIGFIQSQLTLELMNRGISKADATDFAVSVTQSLLAAPSSLSSSSVASSVTHAVDLAAALKNSKLPLPDGVLSAALNDQGIDPASQGKIAQKAEELLNSHPSFASIDSAFKAKLSHIITDSLFLDPSVASNIASLVAPNLKLEKVVADLAQGLLNTGVSLDKAKSQALELINVALSVPDALSSDLSFKNALISAASIALNLDPNAARDIVAKLQLTTLIDKDALSRELVAAFQTGVSPESAAAMAAIVASGLLQNNQGNSPQSAFQNAFGNHVMGTLGVPASAAAAISRAVEIDNILLMGSLQNDVSSAFVNAGITDQKQAAKLAENLIGLILTDETAFSSEGSFRDSAFDNLFINMGFDKTTAYQIAGGLVLEGIFNREAITDSIYLALIASGQNPVQAEILAIKAAETFFLINTPKIDLPSSAGIAQTIALSGAFGYKEMTNALSNLLLDKGLVADAVLRQHLSEQIAAQVIVNPASFSGVDSFRNVLKETLLSVIGTIDDQTATALANQIPITESLRMDILQQAIINAGVNYGFF